MESVHVLKIVFDVFTLLVLLGFFCIIKYVSTPFKSYFLCNDFSVNMPFRESTVSNALLIVISLVMPLLLILTTELTKYLWAKVQPSQLNRPKHVYKLRLSKNRVVNVPGHLGDLYINCGAFLFGCFVTADLTDFAKVLAGRLRPNFLDVCKPSVDPYKHLCKERTFLVPDVDFMCTAPAKLVNESRLSFPSGHSSLSFYAMIYAILFVRYSWSVRRLGLLAYLAQFGLLFVACMTALSRISDNKHHPTDVLGGAVLGTTISVFTFFNLSSFLRRSFISSRYDSLKLASTNEDSLVDMNNNSNSNSTPTGDFQGGVNNRVMLSTANEAEKAAYRPQQLVIPVNRNQDVVKNKRNVSTQDY
jgi:phosphatidate phosphatase